MPVNDNVVIENARLMFRNFAGIERQFNSEGDRNFAVFLDPDMAEKLRTQGFNIKQLRAREEDDIPQDYLKVKVSFDKGRPPRVVMITSRGRLELGVDELPMLDYAEIKNADIVINPYHWTANGNTGVSAYLKSAFITINEDELDLKYSDVPDANPTKTSNSTASEE